MFYSIHLHLIDALGENTSFIFVIVNLIIDSAGNFNIQHLSAHRIFLLFRSLILFHNHNFFLHINTVNFSLKKFYIPSSLVVSN